MGSALAVALGAFLAARSNTQLASTVCAAQAAALAAFVAALNGATRSTAVALAPPHRLRSTWAALDLATFSTAMSDAFSIALLLRVAPGNLALAFRPLGRWPQVRILVSRHEGLHEHFQRCHQFTQVPTVCISGRLKRSWLDPAWEVEHRTDSFDRVRVDDLTETSKRVLISVAFPSKTVLRKRWQQRVAGDHEIQVGGNFAVGQESVWCWWLETGWSSLVMDAHVGPLCSPEGKLQSERRAGRLQRGLLSVKLAAAVVDSGLDWVSEVLLPATNPRQVSTRCETVRASEIMNPARERCTSLESLPFQRSSAPLLHKQ
jgi:hypothetical protein